MFSNKTIHVNARLAAALGLATTAMLGTAPVLAQGVPCENRAHDHSVSARWQQ